MGKRICGGKAEREKENTGKKSLEWPKVLTNLNQWSELGVGVQLHSQILRIRAEDSLIGEDTVEIVSMCTKDDPKPPHVASVIVLSRPVLPASPLGGRTAAVGTPD